MDLFKVQMECDKTFKGRWFDFGASRLRINYAPYASESMKLMKGSKLKLGTDDLAYIISSDVLTGWTGVKDVLKNDVEFSNLVALNALSNDLNFLNLVVEASFDRSKFI